ncbi:MAG: LysM domain-containing protein [bacterium]|nr:LysM domain-containing protein [bacterium]
MKRFLRLFILYFMTFFATSMASAQETNLNIQISYQGFERGFMVWRSDNGHIWVFNYSQTVLNFPASSYGRLPDNPIRDNTRIMPIFGFGKVWGNNANVRDLIGYPIAPEIGGTMQYKHIMPANVIYLAFADVFKGQIEPNGQWFPSGALNPSIQLSGLTANNLTPRVGDSIRLSWQTSGTTTSHFGTVEIYDSANRLLSTETVPLNPFNIMVPNTPKITIMVWITEYVRGSIINQRLAYTSLTLNVTGSTVVTTTPTPTPTTCVSGSTYIVQRGDTLYRIATRCGVTLDALASRNNIVNRNRIFTGQRLIIP